MDRRSTQRNPPPIALGSSLNSLTFGTFSANLMIFLFNFRWTGSPLTALSSETACKLYIFCRSSSTLSIIHCDASNWIFYWSQVASIRSLWSVKRTPTVVNWFIGTAANAGKLLSNVQLEGRRLTLNKLSGPARNYRHCYFHSHDSSLFCSADQCGAT